TYCPPTHPTPYPLSLHDALPICCATQNPESLVARVNPETLDSTQNPQFSDDTQNPETLDSTQNPQFSDDTQNPRFSDDIQNPQSLDGSQNPTSSEDEQNPESRGAVQDHAGLDGIDSQKAGPQVVLKIRRRKFNQQQFRAGEIVVTRRLFRTGDSEYLLNGKLCRLRD